ncbi:MAG: hypothetical protein ACRDDY_13965 [Clostridium sp.]|uniref:hypothetical protein n=1 Tax=Clostridium sp. TaxID=1506 RepID=UPI003EE49B8A
MTKARGTLSTRGWLRTPESRLAGMFTEYEAANPSQSLFYRSKIRSLQSTIQAVGKDPIKLASAIQSDLEGKVKLNFPERAGKVGVECVLNSDETEINIEISITVFENDKSYSLNRVLSTVGESFINLTNAVIV